MTNFSEKDLEREVAEFCMAEQNILDKRLAKIPSRKLSPEFDRKMNRLFFLRKIRYDVFFNTVGKKVAAIILCFVIAFTTTVMSVDALRDGLFELIEKVYSRFSQITFDPVQSTYSTPEVFEEYSITNIPEGFVLETDYINESLFMKEQVFTKGNNSICFGQALAETADFSVDTEGITTQTVEFDNKEFLCFSNKGIRYAIWTEGDYAFTIHSKLPMEKILEMAVSVKK